MPVTCEMWNSRRMRYERCATLTVSEARRLIAVERTKHLAKCRINPSLTKTQALDVFTACLMDKPDERPVDPLIARNIVRECFGKRAKVEQITSVAGVLTCA